MPSSCVIIVLLLSASLSVPAAFLQATAQGNTAAAALPTAEQVVERYVKAIGGRDVIAKLTSRVLRGTLEIGGTPVSGTFEGFEKAPNKSLAVIEIQGMQLREGFDGTVGWSQDPNGVTEQSGSELAESAREADFYKDINLLKRFAKVAVTGRSPVEGRDAHVLIGTFADGASETLYFDVESGLMIRKVMKKPGPDGEQTEYDMSDYKEIDGIRMPFTAKASGKGQQIIMRVSEVKHNVPIADTQFAKPAATQP